MDDRQSQIREQAGLTEARLNEDFIEFLRKYSTPMLLLVAVAAGGFFAFKKYEERRNTKRDAAFAELASATRGEVSPEALTAVADTYPGVGAVSSLALIEAADAHLRNATRGIKPGSELGADGSLTAPEDALTPEERDAELATAKSLFDRVIAANSDRDHAVFRLNAMWGLAAIAEAKSDIAQARQLYEQIESQSRAAGFEQQAVLAKARIDSLPALEKLPPLVSRSDLPAVPVPPIPGFDLPALPTATPGTDVTVPQPEAQPQTQPAPDAAPATPPADAPATPAANP